ATSRVLPLREVKAIRMRMRWGRTPVRFRDDLERSRAAGARLRARCFATRVVPRRRMCCPARPARQGCPLRGVRQEACRGNGAGSQVVEAVVEVGLLV